MLFSRGGKNGKTVGFPVVRSPTRGAREKDIPCGMFFRIQLRGGQLLRAVRVGLDRRNNVLRARKTASQGKENSEAMA